MGRVFLKELLADLSSTDRAEAMKGLRGRMAAMARDGKSPFAFRRHVLRRQKRICGRSG